MVPSSAGLSGLMLIAVVCAALLAGSLAIPGAAVVLVWQLAPVLSPQSLCATARFEPVSLDH